MDANFDVSDATERLDLGEEAQQWREEVKDNEEEVKDDPEEVKDNENEVKDDEKEVTGDEEKVKDGEEEVKDDEEDVEMDEATEDESEEEYVSIESDFGLEEEEIEDFSNMASKDVKVRLVQTDTITEETGVNTEPEWEHRVSAMLEFGAMLSERYDLLLRKQEAKKAEQEKHKLQVLRKKEEATQQHQALMLKLESVRVKLQLNNSKSARKNFLSKKQEATTEKEKAEEERNRLVSELQECERKLAALMDEQREEQRRWQEELDVLRREMEHMRKEAQETELQAVQDEAAAAQNQRDVAMCCIDAWLKELSRYLNSVRAKSPQRYQQERLKWDKEEALVRQSQAKLQRSFQNSLQQLQEGQELESLPQVKVPLLPALPTVNFSFNQLIQSLAQPQFVAPPPPLPPRAGVRPIPPQLRPHFYHDPYAPPHRIQYHQRHPHPHFNPSPHSFQPPLPRPSLHQYGPHLRGPLRVTTPPSHSPSPPIYPVVPSPTLSTAAVSAAAVPAAGGGKLDKVLEKLQTCFPQCTKAELTALLQQVKTSRGTLAGMSMDEVTDQVGTRLAQSTRAAAGGALNSGGRKLCLMCQKGVEPEKRHPLSCTHNIHRDCIRMWLQSSKNNSCPFCPGK